MALLPLNADHLEGLLNMKNRCFDFLLRKINQSLTPDWLSILHTLPCSSTLNFPLFLLVLFEFHGFILNFLEKDMANLKIGTKILVSMTYFVEEKFLIKPT
jgi:hypothetical protein